VLTSLSDDIKDKQQQQEETGNTIAAMMVLHLSNIATTL
jgi:hypothetical protein